MATILYIGTHGTDDPTRATFPFFLAKGAIEAGHEPRITMMMDNVELMRDVTAENIHAVGLPPFKELLDFAVENKVPITV